MLSLECSRMRRSKSEPEDKTRNEVLYARVDIYLAAKKWDMAVAVARHLVKVDPGNPGAWINLAYSVRRAESIEQAEAIVLKACDRLHPRLYVVSYGRGESQTAIDLDKDIRRLAVDGDDPTDQEASECSNTVKYHDVCRSLQNTIPCQNPSTALWLGERESRSRHGWRCLCRVGWPLWRDAR